MFLLFAGVSAFLRSKTTVQLGMEPELVAQLLSDMEHQWVDGAATSAGASGMQSSCQKIASAIIQSSDGDKDRVGEYFNTICSEKSFGPWERDLCMHFAQDITEFMRSDVEYNRDYLDVSKFCTSFYGVVEGTAQVQEKRREVERIEEIKKKAATEKAAAEAKTKAEMAKKEEEKKEEEAKTLEKKEEKKAKAKELEKKKVRTDDVKKTVAKGSTAFHHINRGERSLKKARSEMARAKDVIRDARRVSKESPPRVTPVRPRPNMVKK